ncbi:alpha-amylase family glycosyl hydrolase [Mycobacterium sp. 050134]|uniref:alpha-amylase family glycosyl hydrolase n=1 Tax=Mycobacterium sp. 050134 TaxID=3096111 RepID=UPI002ED9D591
MARLEIARRQGQGPHRPEAARQFHRICGGNAVTISALPTRPDLEAPPQHAAAVTNTVAVQFVYHTGISRNLFSNVRLCGSWDPSGVSAAGWTSRSMQQHNGIDGCPAYFATVEFPDSQVGSQFSWGVIADSGFSRDLWAIPTEISDPDSTARQRIFTLGPDPSEQHYWLSTSRLLGANPRWAPDGGQHIQFAVWAPAARAVSVVLGDPTIGYITDAGNGVVGEPIIMRPGHDGIWETELSDPRLSSFLGFDHRPYMFAITKDSGRVAYRTDLYSRCQIGRGTVNPAKQPHVFSGRREDLDGSVSCSVVVDPQWVTAHYEDPYWPEIDWVTERDFWEHEFDPTRPVPTRLEDLVIYEMHVGGLGAGKAEPDGTPIPGDLADAMGMLDYLVDLGVNAIELMPLAQFEGWATWGYGTSHYFAIEFSGGGRDQFKYFVRECHRRGMAVILDVVYNHYNPDAERAEWAYDSDDPDRNLYYWYEGSSAEYPNPDGGYLDNYSTGWAPRFSEERVRQMFVSSAVAQALEFHVDGFRVDQTTSIHSYNTLHANGRPVEAANAFGAKFLREFTTTLRLVKPHVFLIAEDYSEWEGVTQPTDLGGLGFDAIWYADFYHNLSGDTGHGPDSANLLSTAAIGDDRALAMGVFAGKLAETNAATIVYPESHDEAGNSTWNGHHSGRTPLIAVNYAPLLDDTRRYAEARTRFSAGMALLSAGTPMFFMGEECGDTELYRYNDFLSHRIDFQNAAANDGRHLFTFFRGLITLRRTVPALRSGALEVVHVHDGNRVLAFSRTYGPDQALILASLNNQPFQSGYAIEGVADGTWREVFNSDADLYGGWNDGNACADLPSCSGQFSAIVPRAGFVVFRRIGNRAVG